MTRVVDVPDSRGAPGALVAVFSLAALVLALVFPIGLAGDGSPTLTWLRDVPAPIAWVLLAIAAWRALRPSPDARGTLLVVLPAVAGAVAFATLPPSTGTRCRLPSMIG